ncbi:putative quinol monooxygenase [Roseinatronobacter alkalisoli]|uniref:Antibiotic biosynthesis monooxygenase n=1 Tax=Roseinatronobacter alkalisoli TaxID=3028235 RepID=A0ABT5TBV7_9RHOB|nr:antibiotic biosynthesis monooxygenase [Roseinatronobacter sp. HJB301]MDD7972613.1 antibiotic biosynthesis monooxygenase [Roseinatronobacter sp. HJB301]
MPVALQGALRCADAAQADIVQRHLPEHIRLSRAEAGCLQFDVTPTDDPLVWAVSERFATRIAFDAHQRRVKASVWGQATAAIARSYTVTDI